MAPKKAAFVLLLFAFTEVATWTVDLPDVRKFMFKKHEDPKENDEIVSDGRRFYSNIEGNSKHNTEHHEHENDEQNYAKDYGYETYMERKVSGIVRNGSGYLEGLRRAIERYTQFLESCNNRNNSMTRNLTSWQPPMDSPPSLPSPNMSSNFSISNPPSFNFSEPSPPSFNFSQLILNSSMPRPSYNASNMSITCEEVNERSEHVRRLAQLAMWSTMRLQDLAYARKYQKVDEYEENELILKLAWFLDRLAYLTGFEPEPKEFLPTTTQRPSTVSPTPLTLVPAPESIKTAMMDCLKENSSVPATERCRYPLPIPDIIRQITNTSGDSSPPSTEAMDVIPMPSRDTIPQQSLELLITSDDNPFRNYPPLSRSKRHIHPKNEFNLIKNPFNHFSVGEYFKNHLSNSKSIVKRVFNREESIVETDNRDSIIKPVKSINKTPFHDIKSIKLVSKVPTNKTSFHSKKLTMQSGLKEPNHKKWLSNKKTTVKSNQLSIKKTNFKSTNKSVRNKRSADNPMTKLVNYYFKYKVWDSSNPTGNTVFMNLPADNDVANHLTTQKHVVKRSLFNTNGHILTPLKNLRSFIKHKQRTHYSTYVVQKPKIISHLENIRHQINLNKVTKIESKPKHIRKRSLHYGNMYLPRESANPFGDISFYIKNKEGTEYNPSLVQAAQVRLGLEQIFQTGNIEVVRRYGSNYNPADPAPFYTGILRTNADA